MTQFKTYGDPCRDFTIAVPLAGASLDQVARDTIARAVADGGPVLFYFNGEVFNVYPSETVDRVVRMYRAGVRRQFDDLKLRGLVAPDPAAEPKGKNDGTL